MSTDEHNETRRRGRPALAAGDRKSANLKFRTRPALRERIEAAALENHRTASEEVEYRLERSFELKDVIREAAEVIAEVAVNKYHDDLYKLFGGKEMFQVILFASFSTHSDMQGLIEINPNFAIWYKDEQSEEYKAMQEMVLERVEQLLKYVARQKRGLKWSGDEPADDDAL